MPVFSRLNENLYDFSMITNLKYGSHSGKIIMDRMPPYKFVKNSTHHECDLYHMQSIVEKYFKFIESRREKEWVSLFCPNLGCMQDGLDVKPFIGSSKLSIFFNSVMRNFESMRADYKIVKQTGKNSLLVEWRFETRSYHGYDATFSGMEHFWFSSNGRILKAEASWKPHEVAEQWERQEGSMLGAEQTQSNANMAATATA
jgi:hypothetical protein